MTEQVSRNNLLELAREFYTGGNFEKYIEKCPESRHNSPIVKHVFDKVVETLKSDHPERTYRLDPKEINNIQRRILRALKGSY